MESTMHYLRRLQVQGWVQKFNLTTHGEGAIVLSPPGSGKSWFVEHDGMGQWVDVDEFLGPYLKFHTDEWLSQEHSEAQTESHYRECDRYLLAMREEGLWVVGSLFWEYVADAIVILDEAQHRKWVAKRDDLDWEFAKGVREYLQKQSKEHSVPLYKNWEDLAAAYGMIMGS
tara:strand:- start:294 stop:809 length:516 start_codon:yes stop_codon:yes gene_type:complete